MERNQNYLEIIVRLEPDADVRRAEAMAVTIYASWLGDGASSRPQASPPPALYGVAPWHLGILAGVLTAVTLVAISAALVPASRAARTDPWNALRRD